MDETGDRGEVDVLPILTPQEAFAPVPGKPRRQVRGVRVGASTLRRDDGGRGIVRSIRRRGRAPPRRAAYQDERWELLYRGRTPAAAWRWPRVSAVNHSPIGAERGAAPGRPGSVHLHYRGGVAVPRRVFPSLPPWAGRIRRWITGVSAMRFEPPRLFRRPLPLRGWGHDEEEDGGELLA